MTISTRTPISPNRPLAMGNGGAISARGTWADCEQGFVREDHFHRRGRIPLDRCLLWVMAGRYTALREAACLKRTGQSGQ